jgi:hypothetical protein
MNSKLLWFFVLLLGAPDITSAQSEDRHEERTVETNVPSSVRFQIVQSTLAAKVTFKLDKQQGFVWLLVEDKDKNFSWEFVPVEGLEPNSAKSIRYQLFTSGIAARFTFLLDTETGASWIYVLVTDPKTDEKSHMFQKL